MARVIIHYFTGTGNTSHAAGLIGSTLRSEGYQVDIVQVRKGVFPPHEKYDSHIIAFPVLSWAAPVLMKKYIRKMPVADNARTAILAVNGAIFYNGKLVKGYTGQALEQLENILRKKNYDVCLTGNASYPDNWTQMTNPCSIEDTELIMPLGDAEVHNFIEKFTGNKKELYRCGAGNIAWSWLVAGLFGVVGRRALGKFYIADDNCNGCSLCARACPVQTIKMKEKRPVWGTNCEDCNRCINICPEKAIQFSPALFIIQTTINIALTIAAIWAIVKYIPALLPGSRITLVFTEVIMIIAATFLLLLLSVGPLDAMFRLMCRNAAVRRFFSRSYTAKFRRYTAPGYKPLG